MANDVKHETLKKLTTLHRISLKRPSKIKTRTTGTTDIIPSAPPEWDHHVTESCI